MDGMAADIVVPGRSLEQIRQWLTDYRWLEPRRAGVSSGVMKGAGQSAGLNGAALERLQVAPNGVELDPLAACAQVEAETVLRPLDQLAGSLELSDDAAGPIEINFRQLNGHS